MRFRAYFSQKDRHEMRHGFSSRALKAEQGKVLRRSGGCIKFRTFVCKNLKNKRGGYANISN